MGKNITIQEGGLGVQLTVDKLKTNLVGGGTCLWVPEDSVSLGTKYITADGEYNASSDGYYGYSKVTVSGVGTATGLDDDGDEVVAKPDPETGKLETEKVPSRIEVITPPTNPYGIYMNGQTITTDGMVVKAYLASGGKYGTVPNVQIVLDPTTAVYDKSTDQRMYYSGTSELLDYAVNFGSSPITNRNGNVEKSGGDYGAVFLSTQSGRVYQIVCSENSFSPSVAYTYDGKTVYTDWGNGPDWGKPYNVPINETAINSQAINAIAWTIVYGEITKHRAGSRQQITVRWSRPGDGKYLETSFEIIVAPPIYGDSEN